jgi:hypothetical protein
MEGHAPSGTPASAFVTLSESLDRGHVTPPALNVALTDDMRGLFSRLLATPEEIANAPMPQSELLYWSETINCGATMKLCSDEICMVSVARSGVLVKASKMGRFRRRSVGFFAAVLYNEKDLFKAAQTALTLEGLFPKGRPADSALLPREILER